MMRSLYSGVAGLRNHQTRMDVIGNNIANVNTAGYKTSRVIFQDIFSQNVSGGMGNQGNIGGVNPKQIGLGIRLSNVDVIHTRAAFGRTDKETDVMINGDGFFIVMQTNPETGEDEYLYTRAGNFSIDSAGYLVTSHGYYVMGYAVDPMMGIVDPGQVEVPAIERVRITLAGNGLAVGGTINITVLETILGAEEFAKLTPEWVAAFEDIELNINADGYIEIPARALGPNSVGFRINASDLNPGDEIPNDRLGGARVIQEYVPRTAFRAPIFGLVQSGTPDISTGLERIRVVSDLYQAIRFEELTFAQQDELMVLGPDGEEGGLVGVLRRAQEAEDWEGVQIAQNALNEYILANLAGDFEPEEVGLPGFAVAANGDISVIVANKAVVIGRLGMAMFANPEGLEKAGNSLYRESASSGPVVMTEANSEGAGQFDAGGLEMSNVDLANEFTDMIVTQRGFQANSRIITVSDTMLEELVNLKR